MSANVDQNPQWIGPFRVQEVLGQGGMGVVYRGEHRETGEAVALKTVRAAAELSLASIRREIHALGRLSHPGVVRIVDEGVEGGLPWYAMELLRGETLRRALGTPGEDAEPRDWRRSVTQVHGLCGPLGFLHGNGLVHRDLKPENVFLRPDGAPVLVDFGIAASFGGARGREVLEVGGSVLGSDAYMAPEQIRGGFVDARADLYALGCILYEAIAGRPPFVARRASHLLYQHLSEAPQPPSAWVSGVPQELDSLVLALLAKRPQERPGYAEDVATALEALGLGAPEPEDAPRPNPYLYRPDFAGRGDVLPRLREALERAERRQGGRVFIGGESGVGKTRLAMELAADATFRRMAVVTGECVRLGVGRSDTHAAPLHPLRPLLLAVADRCRERGAAEADRLLGPRGRVLAAYEPTLAQLPGQAAQPEPEPLPAPAARERVLASLRETLWAFAEAQPLLLVLDDLQWADELSLSFLQSLTTERLASRGLLLVGTYRLDEADAALREVVSAPGAVGLELGRLDAESAGEMVRGMLALRETPRRFVDSLVRESSGNPFFIAEYLRAAIDAGMLLRAPSGEWRLETRGITEALPPLPRSIAELIERRLEDLGEESFALVQLAAVLGREFDGELLTSTAGLADAAGMDAVEALRRRQVLEEAGGGRLRFVHDKLREVSYAKLPPGRGPQLHLRAAEAMERRHADRTDAAPPSAALGHHWSRAGVPARACVWFARAGDEARAAYANGEAISFYEAALREAASTGNASASPANAPPLSVERVEESLGDVLGLTGRQREAREAYERALARIAHEARVRRANVHRKVGKALQTHHQNAEALRAYAQAEAALGEAPDGEEVGGTASEWWDTWVQLQGERITVHYWLAQLDAMRALVERVRPVVERRGTAPQRARFFNSLVQMQLRSERYRPSHETVEHLHAYLRAVRHMGSTRELADAQCVAAVVLLFHGDLVDAEEHALASLAEAERVGDVTLQSRCLTYLTVLHRLRRDVEATREFAERTHAVAQAAGMKDYVGAAEANFAWAAWRGGDLPGTERAGEGALALWRPLSLVYPFQWMAHWPLLAVDLEHERVPEAMEHARAMLDTRQQRPPEALAELLTPAVTAWEQSAPDAALTHLLRACDTARQLGHL
ncbi:AAA family ATPase [Myxococcaceae bacterium GXIMD 01537]